MTDLELAMEHLRMSVLSAVARGGDQCAVMVDELAVLLDELDRLAAENRLMQAILELDRPGSCNQVTVHKAHRWFPSRSALDCPGLGPDAEAPREAPRVVYEFGFERMDPPDSGPVMIGRPEADVRAAMTDTAARLPECEYALRRRIVGAWITVTSTISDPA